MSKLDMENILDELVSFDGISHSCIYQHEQIMASTFPSVIQEKLSGIGTFIEKIFTSAHAIDRNHDEIHIELEENSLIAYRVNDDFLLILMAAKSVNLSLVYMTIKSIEKSVKLHGITPPEAKPSQPNFLNVSNTKDVGDYKKEDIPIWSLDGGSEDAPSAITGQQKLERYSNGLKKLLLDSFGPVGDIIFDEASKKWKALYTPELETLGKLVDLITLEIDGKSEKRAFFNKASKYVRRSISEIEDE